MGWEFNDRLSSACWIHWWGWWWYLCSRTDGLGYYVAPLGSASSSSVFLNKTKSVQQPYRASHGTSWCVHAHQRDNTICSWNIHNINRFPYRGVVYGLEWETWSNSKNVMHFITNWFHSGFRWTRSCHFCRKSNCYRGSWFKSIREKFSPAPPGAQPVWLDASAVGLFARKSSGSRSLRRASSLSAWVMLAERRTEGGGLSFPLPGQCNNIRYWINNITM